jgi:hypothetical protein
MSVRPTVARNIRARASEPSGVDAEELQRKLERVSSDIKVRGLYLWPLERSRAAAPLPAWRAN